MGCSPTTGRSSGGSLCFRVRPPPRRARPSRPRLLPLARRGTPSGRTSASRAPGLQDRPPGLGKAPKRVVRQESGDKGQEGHEIGTELEGVRRQSFAALRGKNEQPRSGKKEYPERGGDSQDAPPVE